MEIRAARPGEFAEVRALYHAVIDFMDSQPVNIGWIRDVYPAPEMLQEAIRGRELRVGLEGGEIMASMILNHRCNEGYAAFDWPVQASQEEITVIHALCVHPKYAGRGYARQLVREAIAIARSRHQKAIRLDVLEGNAPAERLYTGLGFQYMHTVRMFYEDTGWTNYELYEYAL